MGLTKYVMGCYGCTRTSHRHYGTHWKNGIAILQLSKTNPLRYHSGDASDTKADKASAARRLAFLSHCRLKVVGNLEAAFHRVCLDAA